MESRKTHENMYSWGDAGFSTPGPHVVFWLLQCRKD